MTIRRWVIVLQLLHIDTKYDERDFEITLALEQQLFRHLLIYIYIYIGIKVKIKMNHHSYIIVTKTQSR